MKKYKYHSNGLIKFLLSFFGAIFVAGLGVAFSTTNGFAGEVKGTLKVEGLTATANTANGEHEIYDWNVGEDGRSITNKTNGYSSGYTCYSRNNTLTLTSSYAKATLSFDFAKTDEDSNYPSSVSIEPEDGINGSKYSTTITNKDKVVIVHKSDDSTGYYSTLSITNITLTQIIDSYETTFKFTEHCSYTISYGDENSVENLGSPTLDNSVVHRGENVKFYYITISLDDGYELYGWQIGDKSDRDSKLDYVYQAGESQIVYPIIKKESSAVFQVDNRSYLYLDEAADAAEMSTSKTIVVDDDGYVETSDGSSELDIPGGVTLLVPFDDANTSYVNDQPDVLYNQYSKPEPYRTLTLKSGTKINFEEGAILSIPSKLNASDTQKDSRNGVPTGKHGKLILEENSKINMMSGSKLYCYGYIVGKGTVNAESGSNVYECMQIRDWRGGSCTSTLTRNNAKIFPFNQYYVQNIESKLVLQAGATETLVAAINMSKSAYQSSFVFVGANEGLFRLSSGYLCKYYDSEFDRMYFEIHDAEAKISPINVKFEIFLASVDIKSSDYVLPIHSGMAINIYSSSVSTYQDISLFPGSSVYVDSNSKLEIANSSSVYVYDKDDCDGWFSNDKSNYNQLQYVSSTNGAPNSRGWTDANAPDAKINIDDGGEISVKSGSNFYTTGSGANICSSGGGKISFEKASSASSVKQCANVDTSNLVEMPVVNARLKNDSSFEGTDEEYTDLEAGTSAVMVYDADQKKWVQESQKTIDVTVLFKDETNTSNSYSITYKHPTEATGFTFPTAEEAGFAADSLGRIVIGWIDKENGNLYEPGDELSARYEEAKTFYAYYGNSWVNINNGSSWNYSYDSTSEEKYPEGLVQLPSPDGTTTNWYLFEKDSKGKLSDSFNSAQGTYGLFHYDSSIYAHGNDKYYFIQNGVLLEEEGVRAIIVSGKQTDYCYISSGKGLDSDGDLDSDGGLKSYVLTSTRKYIANDLGSMSSGFYNIGANGIIHTEDPYVAGNNACYSSDDTAAYGHGLFTYNGYYYYAKEDGSIVKSSSTTYETFYVYRTNNKQYNGSNITAGLYCFDSDGRMLDPTTLKPMEAAS